MNRIVGPLLAVLLAAPFAGAAQAATVNVATTGADALACGSAASPCQTLGYALGNRVTPAADTVRLGPGLFTAPGIAVVNPDATGDTVQGAGSQGLPGGTVLRHANAGVDPQLLLAVPLDLRSLAMELPAGALPARRALSLSSTAAGSRVEDVAVTVANASTAPSVILDDGASGVLLDRLRVSGNHLNDALRVQGAALVAVEDSALQGGTSPAANALSVGASALAVRRSRLSRDSLAAGLDPVVEAISSQLTVDSSLITGGRVGINSQAAPPANAALTLRGVTIDTATPGVGDVGVDRNAVYVRATMPGAVSSTARVERSIFLEPVYTFVEAGSTVRVDCLDSVTPLLTSPTVACGAGEGNLTAAPAALFANPLGDYHLKAGSPAVDGAAAALASGESPTDLDGNPRVLDGNRDCLVRADRGAYELTGQTADPATCAASGQPGSQKPSIDRAPVLKRVSFSRRAFRVRGRKRGTKISFRLSEKATVTMAVEQPRRKGKPKRRGSLTLEGKPNTNTKTFKGRLAGRTLAPGRYHARLSAKDGSGKRSALRTVTFRVLSAAL